MLVAPEDVAEIVRLGTLRAPREACGLLLTRADAGVRVVEVPNRAVRDDETLMEMDDVAVALEELLGPLVPATYPGDLERDLVFWHTHPNGHVGPSRSDMRWKPPKGRCLVVTLPDGEAVQF